jgi:26S proteasome regulatory subunit T5
MAEVNGLTVDELVNKTREFESEVRKIKSNITRVTKDITSYDARIKENKEKLAMSTQLPHMVANVGEILDADDDDEDDKEGSGF